RPSDRTSREPQPNPTYVSSLRTSSLGSADARLGTVLQEETRNALHRDPWPSFASMPMLRTEGLVAEFVHSKSVYRFPDEAGLAGMGKDRKTAQNDEDNMKRLDPNAESDLRITEEGMTIVESPRRMPTGGGRGRLSLLILGAG